MTETTFTAPAIDLDQGISRAAAPEGGPIQYLPPMRAAAGRRHAGEVEIVIPAYNEQRRITGTIRAFVDYFVGSGVDASICVVDNGSIDRTADTVDAAVDGRIPVTLMGCSQQGKGAAVRRGVLTSQARYVGYCDSDTATPAETLNQILPLLRGGHPVVIGSRRCSGARYVEHPPLVRRFGGWVFRTGAAIAVPGVADTQCGFKFFDAVAARRLFSAVQLDGFAFDVEVLRVAQLCGFPIVEVPVHWTPVRGSTLRLTDGIRAVSDLRRVIRIATPAIAAAGFASDG